MSRNQFFARSVTRLLLLGFLVFSPAAYAASRAAKAVERARGRGNAPAMAPHSPTTETASGRAFPARSHAAGNPVPAEGFP